MTTNTFKLALGLVVVATLGACDKTEATPPPPAPTLKEQIATATTTRLAAAKEKLGTMQAAAEADLAKATAEAKAKLEGMKESAAAEMTKAADEAKAKAVAAKADATAVAARSGFVAKAAKALADVKPQVDGLREKGAAMSPLMKAPFDALMKAVDTQWTAAAQGLTDLKAAPPEAVGAKNSELDATLKKLADAVTAASKLGG